MPKHHKKTRKSRIRKKHNNTKKRNKKGGLLFNQSLNIGGIDLSRNTGQKRYNSKTGKWDDYICYKIGPIPFCKIVPAK
jgi:hypothetical protein